MLNFKNIGTAVLTLFLFTTIIFAQSPLPSKAKKVEKLLEISHFDNIIEQQKNMFINKLTQDPMFANHKMELDELYTEALNAMSVREVTITAYCEAFTEDEIDQMIVFNQTPLGQKILSKIPQINSIFIEKMQANLGKNSQKIHDLVAKISSQEKDSKNHKS